MKKTLVFTVLLSLAVGVFAQSGSITELAGTVELKPAGAAGFTAAKAGDAVAQSTIVSTGFKSSAVIAVGSASIVVQPLTRLSLEEIQMSQSAETVRVNLRAGRVRVDVKPPSGSFADFTVVTPSATASVRGTGFEMDTRSLAVNEGAVSFRGARGAAAVVYAGSESAVSLTSGKAANPIAVTESTLLPPSPAGTNALAPTLPPESGTAAVTPGALPFELGFQFTP